MKGRSEAEVQAGVISYLHSRPEIFFWRQNSGAYSPRPGQFLQFGMRGVPDILGVQAPTGRMIGIEVKREVGGKVSPAQKSFGETMKKFGGVYIVARSIEDVKEGLK